MKKNLKKEKFNQEYVDYVERSHQTFYILFPLMLIFGVVLFLSGLFSDRVIKCVHQNHNIYSCEVNIKIFGFGLTTGRFSNIKKAVLAASDTHSMESDQIFTHYQVQFLDKEGKNVTYTTIWRTEDTAVRDMIAINKHFREGKNFNYTFVNKDYFPIIFGLVCIIVPSFLFVICKKYDETDLKFMKQKSKKEKL